MVATFLRQELGSSRFGDRLRTLFESDGVSRDLVFAPDLTDAAANATRRALLAAHRGYGTAKDEYLSGFPTVNVDWAWWSLTPEEVAAVRYIDWDYWLKLSNGTRSPSEAARRIRAGVRVHNVSNDAVLAAAESLRRGATFPEPILVSVGLGHRLVILEGHRRLTAYALAPECVSPELTALVGMSPAIADWSCY